LYSPFANVLSKRFLPEWPFGKWHSKATWETGKRGKVKKLKEKLRGKPELWASG
jgi:hypothetical protein